MKAKKRKRYYIVSLWEREGGEPILLGNLNADYLFHKPADAKAQIAEYAKNCANKNWRSDAKPRIVPAEIRELVRKPRKAVRK